MPRRKYRVGLYQATLQQDVPADIAGSLFGRFEANAPTVQQYGEVSYHLSIAHVGNGIYRGELKRYANDDLPHAGVPNGHERELEMDAHEMTIDRNYFLYYQHRQLIVWQENRRGGPVSALARYLSSCFNTTIAFYPVMTREATVNLLLQDHRPKALEFTVARPLNPELYRNAGDTNRVMTLLAGLGGLTGTFRISANGRGVRGNLLDAARALGLGRELVASGQASKVRLEVEDMDHPIDLLADRLKGAVTVNAVGRYPIADDLYAALSEVKDDFEPELIGIFGQ
ncbi:hypothetical protein KDW98_17850 [Burkholderia vietnamiensis]|uniref:hypothetical protein n=2 Tax=Burkholderia vietnamiensis TaxID=60552 RepID=UPI001B9CCC6E|nr:hypothetical protein [Burkholderia vietnamiensis]MBR8163028.1 hypothetical protein [Burkholderia vietnamiensis]MCA8147972.1 hypothetical protein [Burkholderia vietnamiensis]